MARGVEQAAAVPRLHLCAQVICMIAPVLFACRGSGATVVEAAPQFAVAFPEVKDTVIEREYVADIRAARHAEIRSRFRGILEKVLVDEGQAVKAGQTLFAVNARALKQELLVARAVMLGAEAELKAAQLELQSTKLLQAKNVVSPAEVDLAESKVQTLRAKVEEAKANADRAATELGYAEIKAPFDGVVNRVPRKAGSAIAEDELLTTITDTSDVVAYFRITEREYLEYRRTTPNDRPPVVALRLADGSRFAHEGIVDAITSEFDRETGTLAYRARFPNSAGTLKHGSSGKVVFATAVRNAMLVPQKSTFDVQGDIHVYVVDTNNVPRARKLVVRARLDHAFVVEQGLAPEDRFVLDGIQKIEDGTRIELLDPAAAARANVVHGG
jgi:RND family efflux transporter MFP subunit